MIKLGVYTATEVPAPLVYTFQDSTGATITEIDNPAYTVVFRFQRSGATAVEETAAATDGVVTHTWESTHMATAGSYVGEFAATNGTNTFISDKIRWVVRSAVPAA